MGGKKRGEEGSKREETMYEPPKKESIPLLLSLKLRLHFDLVHVSRPM